MTIMTNAAALLSFEPLLAALVYSVLGVLIFVILFVIIDLIAPAEIWKEITERQNLAVSVMSGLIGMGICIIIAAAISG